MQLAHPRRSALTGLAVVLVLIAVITGLLMAMRPTSPPSGEVRTEDFSAARAMVHLRQIGAVAHPVGSAENARVREYLVAELNRLGWKTSLSQGTSANPRLGAPVPIARVSSIVAELPGTTSEGTVYFDAHYDSVRKGPGSNDDSVAVAGLIEVARALTVGPRPRNNVVLVLTDGEEPGMLGARQAMESKRFSSQGAVVLNLEARGVSGPVIMFETSEGNSGILEHFGRTAQPLGFSLSYEVYRLLPNDTNFTEWRGAGFAGMNFAYLDGSPYYDTGADSLAQVRPAVLQTYGQQNLVLARSLAEADLTQLDKSSVTYFWLPYTLVRYPSGLVLPLAGLAMAALVGLVLLARRDGMLTLRQYGWASLTFLAPLIAAPLLAVTMWTLAKALRSDYGTLAIGDTYGPGWYRAGLVGMALTVVAAWYLLLRKRFGQMAMFVAGLSWLGLLSAVTALLVPGASYLFTLPVLVTAAAAIVMLGRPDWQQWWPLVYGGACVVTACLAVPIVALLFPALGVALGLAPALLIVLLAVPALPLLDLVELPDRPTRLTAAGAAGLSLLLFGIGVVADPSDAEHPRLSSLVYAKDADTGTARWLSADPAPNDWSRQFVTDAATPMEADLPPLVGLFISSYLAGPAQVIADPAPELSIVEETVVGAQRSLRLKLSSPRGAPVAWVHLAADAPRLVSAIVDGIPVPAEVDPPSPGGKWGWGFSFHTLPAEGVEITLTFAAADPVEIRVIDESTGLSGIPGYLPPPAEIRPSVLPSESVYVARTFRL